MGRLRSLESSIANVDHQVDHMRKEMTRRKDSERGHGPTSFAFPAKVVAYREIAANRYEYQWLECIPDPDNVGKWKLSTDETLRSSEGWTYPAWNGAEAGNDGAGYESGGMDVSATSFGGFYLQPTRGGTGSHDPGTSGSWSVTLAPVVPMMMTRHIADGTQREWPTYWFYAPNMVAGECS